jgi:hypothetical protein
MKVCCIYIFWKLLWDVTLWSLAHCCRRFGGNICLYFQGKSIRRALEELLPTCFGLIDHLQMYKLVLQGVSHKTTVAAADFFFRLVLYSSHARVQIHGFVGSLFLFQCVAVLDAFVFLNQNQAAWWSANLFVLSRHLIRNGHGKERRDIKNPNSNKTQFIHLGLLAYVTRHWIYWKNVPQWHK